MSIFNYLQLQPVEPSDDGTVSDLDEYTADDTIDLNADIDETELEQTWEKVLEDRDQDPEKLTFHEE